MKVIEEQIEGDTVQCVYLHDKATHRAKGANKNIPLVFVVAGSEGIGIDNTVKFLISAAYNLGYRTIAVDSVDLFDT